MTHTHTHQHRYLAWHRRSSCVLDVEPLIMSIPWWLIKLSIPWSIRYGTWESWHFRWLLIDLWDAWMQRIQLSVIYTPCLRMLDSIGASGCTWMHVVLPIRCLRFPRAHRPSGICSSTFLSRGASARHRADRGESPCLEHGSQQCSGCSNTTCGVSSSSARSTFVPNRTVAQYTLRPLIHDVFFIYFNKCIVTWK